MKQLIRYIFLQTKEKLEKHRAYSRERYRTMSETEKVEYRKNRYKNELEKKAKMTIGEKKSYLEHRSSLRKKRYSEYMMK